MSRHVNIIMCALMVALSLISALSVTASSNNPTITITPTVILPAYSIASPSYVTVSGSGFTPGSSASIPNLDCAGACNGFNQIAVDQNGNFVYQYAVGIGSVTAQEFGNKLGIFVFDNSPTGPVKSNVVYVFFAECGTDVWGAKGTIVLSSLALNLNDSPTLSGTGFTPNSKVSIRLYVQPYPPQGGIFGGTQLNTSSTGAFQFNLWVGKDWPSQLNIDAIDLVSCGHSNMLTVTVSPHVSQHTATTTTTADLPPIPSPEFPTSQSLIVVVTILATLLLLKRRRTITS